MSSFNSAPATLQQLPFIGRGKELQQVLQFYQQAIEGDEISVLWINGEGRHW